MWWSQSDPPTDPRTSARPPCAVWDPRGETRSAAASKKLWALYCAVLYCPICTVLYVQYMQDSTVHPLRQVGGKAVAQTPSTTR